MTDEEVEVAARGDPDAQPIDEAEWATLRPVPRSTTIRRAFELFATI